MNVQMEFTGIPRVVVGLRHVKLDVATDTTFRDIVRLLGVRYPQLIGEVIHTDGETLQASNMLNLNGQRMIQPAHLDECPGDGDRLILMSILAGG